MRAVSHGAVGRAAVSSTAVIISRIRISTYEVHTPQCPHSSSHGCWLSDENPHQLLAAIAAQSILGAVALAVLAVLQWRLHRRSLSTATPPAA